MIRAIRERLEYKILLLLTAVLVIGFGSYVIVSIQKESEQMVKDHHEKLWLYSETLMAGIRTVMLTGKAPFAAELVNDVRQNLKSFGDLTIYDRLGREVFLREGEGVIYNVHETDTLLNQTLTAHSTHWTMVGSAEEEILTRYEPLYNRAECWRCHNPGDHIRGVLQLALKPTAIRAGDTDETVRQTAGIMGDFIATAFRNIMVGGGGEFMDTLMLASKNIPAVEQVRVYSRLGDIAFGDDEDEVDADPILELIDNQVKEKQFQRNGDKLRLLLPLANEDRCQVCHGERFPMRGVLAVDFHADSLRMFSSDVAKKLTPVFQTALFEGFRGIMLVGRAGSARYYLDEIRSLPVIQKLSVYDKDGNERFLNPAPRTRAETKIVADSATMMEFVSREADDDERLVMLTPLKNEQRCYSCHGKNHQVRAVVEISASMKDINEAVASNKFWSTGVGIVTIFFVWGVLRLFMNSVVVRPVKAIEGIALRVGAGDFSAQADVTSRDEIGNLARRINEMTKGLRERLHLQKFVSRQTADAVSRADLKGVRLGGERKTATVFFSDIRGFTAFSEKVEPEKVVAMLNHCLAQQSVVVKKYGGDIDKYVGDELVAVFEGEKMVENALRAALEIQELTANDPVFQGNDQIAVGIGINTGEMVMGAMGSEERMDYTVIGDNVNLGARLCSAAKGGQILMSDFALKYLGSPKEFKLVGLDAIKVKGKAKPIKIYEVQKRKMKT